MWVGGMLGYLVAGTVVFFRWAGPEAREDGQASLAGSGGGGAWRLRVGSSAKGSSAGLIGAAAVALLILIFDIASGDAAPEPGDPGLGHPEGHPRPQPRHRLGRPRPRLHRSSTASASSPWDSIAAFLVASAEREPEMVLALLIFFAAFEVFFLALIAFWALPVLGVLAWWEILAGNLVASAAMLYYFHRCHPGLARSLIGRWVDVVREGIMAGFLGGSVVAVWFLLYDAIRLRPLHTPALLGAAVLQGLRDPHLLIPRLDVVVGYTIFHFAAFAFFGIAVAAFLLAAEREPRILLGLFTIFLCFQVFFFGFLQALDAHLAGALPWWNVAIGNLLASVAMITYFFLGHRSLGTRLLERWTEED